MLYFCTAMNYNKLKKLIKVINECNNSVTYHLHIMQQLTIENILEKYFLLSNYGIWTVLFDDVSFQYNLFKCVLQPSTSSFLFFSFLLFLVQLFCITDIWLSMFLTAYWMLYYFFIFTLCPEICFLGKDSYK